MPQGKPCPDGRRMGCSTTAQFSLPWLHTTHWDNVKLIPVVPVASPQWNPHMTLQQPSNTNQRLLAGASLLTLLHIIQATAN